MGVRIAIFYSCGILAGTVGAFIAAGITRLDASLGLHGWQWLFLIEGGFTVLVGFVCLFYLPDDPSSAWFLDATGRAVMSRRIQDEQQQQQCLANDTTTSRISWRCFLQVVKDPVAWLFSAMALFNGAVCFSISLFLPSLVRDLGYDGAQAQIMSAPPYLLACLVLLLNSWHSDRTMERGWHVAVPLYCGALGYLLLALLHGVSTTVTRYLILNLTTAAIFSHVAPALAWMNAAFADPNQRAIALGFILTFSNLGGVVSGQVYRGTDAPGYVVGHGVTAAMALTGATLTVWQWWRMRGGIEGKYDT